MARKQRTKNEPVLLPRLQQINRGTGTFTPGPGCVVVYSAPALREHARHLARCFGLERVRLERSSGYCIAVTDSSSAVSDGDTPPQEEEGYALSIRPDHLVIRANTARGMYYGVQTVSQLGACVRKRSLPVMEVHDYPDMELRAVQISYHAVGETLPGFVPNADAVVATLERMSKYKLNTLVLEFEAMFPYARHPELRGKLTFSRRDIRRIAVCARRHHVEVIPLIQSIGHSDNVLRHPEHAHLREVPERASTFCATHPEAKRLVFDMIDDVLDLMPDVRRFHIGGDEIGVIGCCDRCREVMERKGLFGVITDFFRAMAEGVHDRGRIPVVWSDYLEKSGDFIGTLPRYLEIMYWNYHMHNWGRAWAADFFLRHGFKVIGASGIRAETTNCFAVPYEKTLGTVIDLPAALKSSPNRNRVLGVNATNWAGGSFYEHSWYGIAAHAAAAWSGTTMERADRDFPCVHYGVDAPELGRAYRLLGGVMLPYARPIRAHRNNRNRYDLTGMPFETVAAVYSDDGTRRAWLSSAAADMRRVRSAGAIIDRVRRKKRLRNRHEIELLAWCVDAFESKYELGRLVDRITQTIRHRRRITARMLEETGKSIEAHRRRMRSLRRRYETIVSAYTFPESLRSYLDLVFGDDIRAYLDDLCVDLKRAWAYRGKPYADNRTSARESGMHFLETSGDAFARGQAQGRRFARVIRENAARTAIPDTAESADAATATGVRGYLEKHAAYLLEELDGIGAGANVAMEQVLTGHLRSASLFSVQGTCVAYTGQRIVLGRTGDVTREYRSNILVRQVTTDKRQLLCIGPAGTLRCEAGLNDKGLAVACNVAPDPATPVCEGMFSEVAAYDLLLTCATVKEAVGRIRGTPWAGRGTNLLLADRDGYVAAVSKSGTLEEIRICQVGWDCVTNHYSGDELARGTQQASVEKRYSRHPWVLSTAARLDAVQTLTRLCCFSDAETVKTVFSHHASSPSYGSCESICRHNASNDGVRSLWSAVADVDRLHLHVSGTYPCRMTYRTLKM